MATLLPSCVHLGLTCAVFPSVRVLSWAIAQVTSGVCAASFASLLLCKISVFNVIHESSFRAARAKGRFFVFNRLKVFALKS